MARVGSEERQRIIDLLQEHGGNRNRVARMVGRSVGTVQTIATQENIPSAYSAPKKANEARSLFAEIDRMEIIGLGLNTGAELLRGYKDRTPSIENIRAYKDLMTGLAIGIDKHRLETGEVTNRTESRKGDDWSLENEFGELDAALEEEEQEEGAT